MEPFSTAEAAAQHVKSTKLTGTSFELPIADNLTVGGRPDSIGMGMAIVGDAILAQSFMPDGFEQREGYKLYKYKPLG